MASIFDFENRQKIITHLRKDAVLRPLVDELPFPEERIHLSQVYPSLLRSIIAQQVSTAAARAIYRRFLGVFDLDIEDPLVYPDPQVLAKAAPETLRGAGLSGSKVIYVQALAEWFAERPKAEAELAALSNEEIIAELTQIKGVGQWTVEMMLIFSLGRLDLLPLDDLAVFQSMIQLYDLPPDQRKASLKKQMTEIAEKWRPYRSVACLYLYAWRGLQSQRKKAGGA